MPVATITSKGQITIPKKIRDALNLAEHDKVTITLEEDMVVIKPIKGNILDIGASDKISAKDRPIDFKKTRKETVKNISKHVVKEGE